MSDTIVGWDQKVTCSARMSRLQSRGTMDLRTFQYSCSYWLSITKCEFCKFTLRTLLQESDPSQTIKNRNSTYDKLYHICCIILVHHTSSCMDVIAINVYLTKKKWKHATVTFIFHYLKAYTSIKVIISYFNHISYISILYSYTETLT